MASERGTISLHVNTTYVAFHELKRRNVSRVGAACIVAARLIEKVSETLFPIAGQHQEFLPGRA
jgi:hypothetical protein